MNSCFLSSNHTDTTSSELDQNINTNDILNYLHISIVVVVVIHLIYLIYMLIKFNCCKRRNDQHNLRRINDSCSICLENVRDEVQMLCSHSYCAACVIDYGKQRWNFMNIQCPICRSTSRLLVAQFERNDLNKELYDEILQYNHQVTSHISTSFCFCLDMIQFTYFYLKQLTNLNNPRYSQYRFFFLIFMFAIIVIIIYPVLGDLIMTIEILKDVIVFVILFIIYAESFYRRFRSTINREYENYSSEIQGRINGRIENENSLNRV